MTDKPENRWDSDVDAIVSAEYHRLATDLAPDDLNQAVLHSSRRALGKRLSARLQAANRQGAWFRPVASAAVIALSLAVILEFNDAGNLQSPLVPGDEARQFESSSDVFREAGENAAAQLREAEEAASRASQNSSPDESPTMTPAMENDQNTLLPVARGCDELQRTTTASWWQCIESLENRGARALAEQELTLLLRSYPAFVEPRR